ncbi:MAG: glycosyltransferase family 4 protein, partial [Candidatus Omnitrophica bacterium]|nr:glycosyltransferase family 4 protein [Candidatus Omnitrophota bacterium]
KPVIGGRSGGSCDAVLEGKTGLLVDSTRPDAIAEALIKILTDEMLAGKMGDAGRQWVEDQLHWPVLLKRYDDLSAKKIGKESS